MNRKADLPNGRDVNRRVTAHDLQAAAQIGEALTRFGECDPCDCIGIGTIQDCEQCGRGSPQLWSFRYPDEALIVAGVAETPGALEERSLSHAEECLWEGDSIPISCDDEEEVDPEEEDEFGWKMEIEGATAGANALVFERLSGSGCRDTKIVYRNVFPWQCTCANPMLLARDECLNVNIDALPCTVCVAPGTLCDVTNWEVEIEGFGTFRTSSDPTFAEFDTCLFVEPCSGARNEMCTRRSDFVEDVYMTVIYEQCFCGSSIQERLVASFATESGGVANYTAIVDDITVPNELTQILTSGTHPEFGETITISPIPA